MVLWLPNVLVIHSDPVPWLSFSFPCLSNIFFLTCVTDYEIYEVKTIACEAVFQFKSSLNVFKDAGIIYQEIFFQEIIYQEIHSHLLSEQLNIPDKISPNSASVKRFLRLRHWPLSCINLILWKPLTLLFFKQLTEDLIRLQILRLFGLNVVMNGKMFSFDGFLGLRKSFFWHWKSLLKSLFY